LRFQSDRKKSWKKKTKSFGGKIFLGERYCAFKRDQKKSKKKSLLAGKLSLEKKVCAFEWCLVLSQKYTKSFGGKNLALCNRFVPSKVKVYV
jgi:hypothetical protein